MASGLANIKVITGYDRENNCVYVTFIDSSNANNNETLAYHEPSNRWMSFFSFIPDLYMFDSAKVFSFKTGGLYVHNDSSVNRCTFYGTKYNHEYKVVTNSEFQVPKVFYNLAIHSNYTGWSVPEIEIPIAPNYPRGMKSRLNAGRFTAQEGILYAAFMRNMLTTSSDESQSDLIDGDQLRGESMSLTLRDQNNTETNLYEVDITFMVP